MVFLIDASPTDMIVVGEQFNISSLDLGRIASLSAFAINYFHYLHISSPSQRYIQGHQDYGIFRTARPYSLFSLNNAVFLGAGVGCIDWIMLAGDSWLCGKPQMPANWAKF